MRQGGFSVGGGDGVADPVTQQYRQALVVHSSSMDSLLPLEIELADRLIAHFLPGFVFTET